LAISLLAESSLLLPCAAAGMLHRSEPIIRHRDAKEKQQNVLLNIRSILLFHS
jgi:hypothetical protein